MRHSTVYTVLFAAAICVLCGILVSSAAVSLSERQEFNAALDKKKKVLEAAGLATTGEALTAERVAELFQNIDTVAVDLRTGEETDEIDTEQYEQIKAVGDPEQSFEAAPNSSAIKRVPNYAEIYKVKDDAGNLTMLVLPIEGLGLWGTLYGFLALDADLETIRGITYYQHKETPGLGGEVDNPRWKALWVGRKAFDDSGTPRITVIKGQAGPVASDPYHVDGLSGATITSRGVTNMLEFWLDERGFGPYLENLRAA